MAKVAIEAINDRASAELGHNSNCTFQPNISLVERARF